jgi:hypothetical protein
VTLKEVPISVHTKIIFVIAEVDEIFPVFLQQGSTIRIIVNLSDILQLSGEKSA